MTPLARFFKHLGNVIVLLNGFPANHAHACILDSLVVDLDDEHSMAGTCF
ncbi:hypothetical protein AF72_08925 [Xylella taiwanensis]|uniref:Uncharacterized protein n=1 Tax=Xylella taiwanensis TaxID=1444770 RepID=Z9JHX8_9GAMM|nr:hypothetical protein AF72_08925 [Xylella taiwanensis]